MKRTDNSDIEEALTQNDEEWQKRMLLLVMTMIIVLIALD